MILLGVLPPLLLLLGSCAAPERQASSVPPSTQSSQTGPLADGITLCGVDSPASTTFLELTPSGSSVSISFGADGQRETYQNLGFKLSLLTRENLRELAGLTKLNHVTLMLSEASEETQLLLLEALSAVANLTELAIDGAAVPLDSLALPALERLSLRECDTAALPPLSVRALFLTNCTGFQWGSFRDFTQTEVLGVYGTGMPETAEDLMDHPSLVKINMDLVARTGEYDPETYGDPFVLQGPDAVIPPGLVLPCSESLLLTLAKDGGIAITFNNPSPLSQPAAP